MYRVLCLCLCIWIASSCADVAKVHKPRISLLPVLKVAGDSTGKTLKVSKLLVDVQVTGNIATTTFDITFFNEQERQLEGEFDFPLADGQAVSRYALEVDSALREGVVVEKAKARVAFENTSRRKIDPGLVEKTTGNHFRTRVYPIPARGYKRIVIGIEQTLQASDGSLLYDLPLSTTYKLDRFAVTAAVAQPSDQPLITQAAGPGFAFRNRDRDWSAAFQQADYQPSDGIAFTIPLERNKDLVYTETHGGNDYFYAYLAGDSASRARPLPKTVTLFWDVSGSGAQRNLAKETALVEAYLAALQDVTVTVVPFAIETYPASVFRVTGGDATAVTDLLKKSGDFDGGTQLGALDFSRYPADELWLLSDGISTFGKKEIGLSAAPVTVVASSPGANFSYLKYIARQTSGRFVDLASGEAKPMAEQLLSEHRQFLRAEYDRGAIDSLVTPVQTGLRNGFAVAGILKQPSATITLYFGFGKTVSSRQTLTVRRGQAPTAHVGRIWANMMIGELDLRYAQNKDAVTRLGKQFSIVTQNTSLLVLDRVEDYVEHEIEPPAGLLPQYRLLLAEKQASRVDERALALEEAKSAMKELVDWWKEPVRKLKTELDTVGPTAAFTRPVPVADAQTLNAATDTTSVVTTTTAEANGTYGWSAQADVRELQLTVAPSIADEKPALAPPAIDVQEWKADAPYLAELEATPAAGRYRKYLSLKPKYAQQPSFFIDVARFFYAQHDAHTALQVLSNVTELKLESPELLRNVAEQLLEFGETALAVETFKDVLELREEEPQAYRDLALAFNEAGNYSEAVKLLYKVATGVWDSRFSGVREVALSEMNGIIGAHRQAVDLAGIDDRFVKALPVDVRIVIGWSADNSDIDLWVTDPRKEKCYYGNSNTALGGRISRDATEGYGPEEFLLKKAPDGAYDIDVNLFGDRRETISGPITIKAELFTVFGRPTQQRKVISFRVSDNKEVVRIGKLQFGKG